MIQMHWIKCVRVVLGFGAAGVMTSAQEFAFTRIIQSGDPIPAGGSFGHILLLGTDSAGRAVFSANDSGSNYAGVFSSAGGSTTLIANYATLQPGGSETFDAINPTSIDGTTVYFRGHTATTDGLYYRDAGGLHTLVTTGTAAAGGGNFGAFDFSKPFASNGTVAFVGSVGSWNDRVFLAQGGVTSLLLAKTDTIPGHAAAITGFGYNDSYVGNDSGNLALLATSSLGQVVVGYTNGGGLRTLADYSTSAPGAGTAFTGFGSFAPSVDGATAFFQGSYEGGAGIYSADLMAGGLSLVANLGTAVPGGGGNFTGFSSFTAADGGVVAFLGDYAGGRGIFLHEGNTFYRIVGTGDTLDGRTVTGVTFGSDSLSGDEFVFEVAFSGGDVAVYGMNLAAIPEPSTYVALTGLMALGLAVWWRRQVV